MDLYEKAIQYYSAINDFRYQIYMRKTKRLFSQITDNELKKYTKKGDGKKKKKKGGKKDKTKDKEEETKKEENEQGKE